MATGSNSEGPAAQALTLARDLVAIDSRSFVSNRPVIDRLEAELAAFDLERLDYRDGNGVEKRVLIAHREPPGNGARTGLALSGHTDTVPDTGWSSDPFDPRIADGALHGLGSCDMKGPLAAAVAAAKAAPAECPVTLMITADEETTKQGAREMAQRSELLRRRPPKAIQIVEPTSLQCVRSHRISTYFTATAPGVQAHSSTGKGENANLRLIPFLVEMRAVWSMLRHDETLHDPAFDPPFCDFNMVIDNHGAAPNVTVPRATCVIKFRYSKSVDREAIVARVRAATADAGVELDVRHESHVPELEPGHPLVRLACDVTGLPACTASLGTDASELCTLAPTIVLGPGDLAFAHQPTEQISLAQLEAGTRLMLCMIERVASHPGL
jgi:acetylornithine deacetylase